MAHKKPPVKHSVAAPVIEKPAALPDYKTEAARPQPSKPVRCFGVYKAADGNWILREVVVAGSRVIECRDGEPDILAIQMGKVEQSLSLEAERLVNGQELRV